MAIIGRQKEQLVLQQITSSDKAEFIALYGRRRIGKTFLIKEYFNHQFAFYATGVQNDNAAVQLNNFMVFVNEKFKTNYATPVTWMQAFRYLKTNLAKRKSKQIVFIDELPWMDTKGSDLLTALDWFWNSWASTQKNIKLIVCGSAAAWMIGKLLRNKGGLYNRLTERLHLQPFNLHETELFLKYKNIALDRYQIAQLYMALGGIPYYLDNVQKGLSAAQNIEKLCFVKGALLQDEFNYIFQSLFGSNSMHSDILLAMHQLKGKANREQLLQHLGWASSGNVSTKLWELEESGFINTATEYGTRSSKKYYYISDFYTLFYFKFIQQNKKFQTGIWVNRQLDQAVVVWQGLSYEQICWQHLEQIKKALQIAGMFTEASTWRLVTKGKQNNAQIDLVIDRKDKVINLIEVKFYNKPFTITKSYDMQLRNKLSTFEQAFPTKKAVWMCICATYGLQQNAYSNSLVQSVIVLNDIFMPD